MYCDNCGEKIPEGARYCKNCGAEVPKSYLKTKSDSKLVWMIVAAVAVIVLVGIFSLALSSDDADLSLDDVSTSGKAYGSVYNYTLTGNFKDLPDDSEDYTVKAVFLDGNNEVGQFKGELNDSLTATLQKRELVNVTQVQVIVLDSYGDELFSHVYDYDMDDFDLSDVEEDSPSYSFVEDRDFTFLSDD